MKLITNEIRTRFQQIGSQESEIDPIVAVKIFNPYGSGTWYCTELLEDDIFFGYVDLLEKEWGYFSLKELEDVRCPPFNLPLERDAYCGEKRISEHCPELASMIKRNQELRDIEDKKDKEQNLER